MKFTKFLTTPFLLRRLVRDLGRIATALEDLVSIQCRLHGFTARPSAKVEEADDFDAITYANDLDSFKHEQDLALTPEARQ